MISKNKTWRTNLNITYFLKYVRTVTLYMYQSYLRVSVSTVTVICLPKTSEPFDI